MIESPSTETQSSNSNTPVDDQKILPLPPKKATGPRTKKGIESSKRNAVKHGIFSTEVLLNREFRWEFNALLRGLRADFNPEGTLEGILVEKLATLIWRYRRMLIAEQAEIRRGTEYFWWDESVRQDQEATIFLKGQDGGKSAPGLILGIKNPLIRVRCVEQLHVLKRIIEMNGFDSESDLKILRMGYGVSALASITYCSVATYYAKCFLDSQLTEQERLKTNRPSPAECKANFLGELEKQIKGLETDAEVIARAAGMKEDLEQLCLNVPEGPKLDRLLRYGASLERALDRTLSQLERLQRVRLS